MVPNRSPKRAHTINIGLAKTDTLVQRDSSLEEGRKRKTFTPCKKLVLPRVSRHLERQQMKDSERNDIAYLQAPLKVAQKRMSK
jgi:hypothetical protein